MLTTVNPDMQAYIVCSALSTQAWEHENIALKFLVLGLSRELKSFSYQTFIEVLLKLPTIQCETIPASQFPGH